MTYAPNTKCISHSHPHPAVEHIHIGSCMQLLCTAVDRGDIVPGASPKVQLLIDQNRHMALCTCWLVEVCNNVIYTCKFNYVARSSKHIGQLQNV